VGPDERARLEAQAAAGKEQYRQEVAGQGGSQAEETPAVSGPDAAQGELGPEELAEELARHLAAAEGAASAAVHRLLVPLRILWLSSSEALHCLARLQHQAGSSPPERAALLLTLTDWAVTGLHGPAGWRRVLPALAREWCRLLGSPGLALAGPQLAAARTALARLVGAVPAESAELAWYRTIILSCR
jgi:hypothetical protein